MSNTSGQQRRQRQHGIRGERLMRVLLILALVIVSCSDDGSGPESTTLPAQRLQSGVTATTTVTAGPSIAAQVATPGPSATTPAAAATVEPFQPSDLTYLQSAIDQRLDAFEGWASYYVHDLSRGQVIRRDADVPISGTSMVKIPILLETYRALTEAPSPSETRLITETATLSGNYTANLLMELVAGRPDPFVGAIQVTLSMRRLGLYDTFIAVPYDLEPDARYLSTYATPANQRGGYDTNPDSSMQTTVSDMGRLLSMIYECSRGQGYLLDVYAGSLTQVECTEIIDVMGDNDIDAFVEAGVPEGVAVAHKHGWVGDTHGDAAIVLLPEFPYVLAIAVHRTGWLEWADSTAVIADVSRLTYAHFTDPRAYALTPAQGELPVASSAPAPTPSLPTATIEGTGGVGVVLRESPGGQEVMIIPEGSLVFLLDDHAAQDGGRAWRKVRLLGDVSGWIVSDFLDLH